MAPAEPAWQKAERFVDLDLNLCIADRGIATPKPSHWPLLHCARITAHLLIPGFTYIAMNKRVLEENPAAAWRPEQVAADILESMIRGDFYTLCLNNDVDLETDHRRAEWATEEFTYSLPALSRGHPGYGEAFADFMARSSTAPESTWGIALDEPNGSPTHAILNRRYHALRFCDFTLL